MTHNYLPAFDDWNLKLVRQIFGGIFNTMSQAGESYQRSNSNNSNLLSIWKQIFRFCRKDFCILIFNSDLLFIDLGSRFSICRKYRMNFCILIFKCSCWIWQWNFRENAGAQQVFSDWDSRNTGSKFLVKLSDLRSSTMTFKSFSTSMMVILLIFNSFSFTEKTVLTKSETEAVENQ